MFKNWEIVHKNLDFWLLLKYWKCYLLWGWPEVGEVIEMGSWSSVQPSPHLTSLRVGSRPDSGGQGFIVPGESGLLGEESGLIT